MKPTQRPFYAANARNLLESRQRGFRPAGPVHVVMDGTLDGYEPDPILYLRGDMPLERMDWRMLVDLEVWIWAGPEVPLGRILDASLRIAHAKPSRLALRFDDGKTLHDIDIGSGTHRGPVEDIPAEHSFCWSPIQLGWDMTGKRLCQALRTKHRMWSYV